MNDKEIFDKCWKRYWFKNKPLSNRLLDPMEIEANICAKFYEALKQEGHIR